MTSNIRLPFDTDPVVELRIDVRDRDGRARAVDPRFNVALEASAGTGKTRLLVERYVNLLRAGVDPSNILAITFTRKAATEMRERIMKTLRRAADGGEIPTARWRELRDRTDKIAVSTIDAFCLSLLREFPLEADLEPGFGVADETEIPRLVDESLDRALRACRRLAMDDDNVALAFAQLGDRRARRGLAALLERRLVAAPALQSFLAGSPGDLDAAKASRNVACAIRDAFAAMPSGLNGFLSSGPPEPTFLLLVRDLQRMLVGLDGDQPVDPVRVQAVTARLREYFLTQDGEPRKKLLLGKACFARESDWAAHRDLVVGHAATVRDVLWRFKRDLNVLVSRAVLRMYHVAEREYRRTLERHAVLDFSDLVSRTLDLLRNMEEFSQSRYRLESRYHHVLVDEFQDTSRAQWELISLLVQSWGEGAGLAAAGPLQPSIFIVGDRKQSIYTFRDADVSVLRDASRYLETLRPDGDARRSISRSYRSVPPLLAFVNDVSRDVDKVSDRGDGFSYDEEDWFPVDVDPTPSAAETIALVLGETPEACAEAVAGEIARLLADRTVIRDRDTGVHRAMVPADVGILFRARDSHREFEAALDRRGIPSYVYKGLGFFDTDEVKDVLALLWYLASPDSNLRAAALLRSRFVRLSDDALRRLAPNLASALSSPAIPPTALAPRDVEVLALARDACTRWRGLVDRVRPAELLDRILDESAYVVEMRGTRYAQARENLKKLRGIIRRIQNRGYATLERISSHLDRLAVGDDSNAVVDGLDAVNLMTVHAAKGLEFPVVFVVNLSRGTGGGRHAIRVTGRAGADVTVGVGDFRSDADEDESARHREETKRLLYVAVTRARDRLYLGSVLKDGRVQPGRGSLAEVLPPSLIDRMSVAWARQEPASWQASSGASHRLGLVKASCRGMAPEPERPAAVFGTKLNDFMPLLDIAPARLTVGQAVAAAEDAANSEGIRSDRLVGTLVHRLLQRFGVNGHPSPDPVLRAAVQLIRADESHGLDDLDAVSEAAVDAYLSICADPAVRAVYVPEKALHEVPFSMRTDGRVLRGTVDCLVMDAPGKVVVLEFKTGKARSEHLSQLELYRRAVETLFPSHSVEARLIYAGHRPA